MAGGGGGSSGKVSYPDWQEDILEEWAGDATSNSINTNMYDAINSAHSASPYTALSNPAGIDFSNKTVSDLQTDLNNYSDASVKFEERFDGTTSTIYDSWKDVFDLILVHLKGEVVDDYIDAEIVALDNQLQSSLNNNLAIIDRSNQLTGIWSTSAKFFAKAKIIEEHDKVITLRGAELRNRTFDAVFQRSFEFALAETSLRKDLEKFVLTYNHNQFARQLDLRKLEHTAMVDDYLQDMDLAVKDAMWDVEVLLKGSQILGTISGATFIPDKPSAMQSAVAGAATGAGVGMMVGGPVGAGWGAAIGAGAGLLGAM